MKIIDRAPEVGCEPAIMHKEGIVAAGHYLRHWRERPPHRVHGWRRGNPYGQKRPGKFGQIDKWKISPESGESAAASSRLRGPHLTSGLEERVLSVLSRMSGLPTPSRGPNLDREQVSKPQGQTLRLIIGQYGRDVSGFSWRGRTCKCCPPRRRTRLSSRSSRIACHRSDRRW